MAIIEKYLTNTNVFRSNRDGQGVQLFVIHKQAGNGMLYNFFQGGSRGTSTHYQVMKSGQIYQFVREEHTAYANGNWGWNVRGLSIEFEGMFTDTVTNEQYENCSQLIAGLSKKYSFPLEYRDANALKNYSTRGVTIHKNIVSTACPANVDYMRVINRAREILNVNVPPMFDFQILLEGKETKVKILVGSCNELATIRNLTKGTSWTANINGGVGHVSNPVNTDTEQCLYEITLKGVTHQLDNRVVVDPKDVIIESQKQEINTLKGLLNEKDGQISSLNVSVSDLNTKLAICTQEKQDLLLRADKLDAEFSDFKATSAATQENLEEDISKKASAIEVLTKNNERLQEELRACEANGGGGVNPNPVLTILARFAKWLKEILNKRS
jgi:hypothetical protein